MNSPVYYDHDIKCPNCLSIKLELYDENNNPLHYEYIKKYHINTYIRGRYFKCKCCNNEFDINWADIIPKPLDKKLIKEFLKLFSEYSI